MKPGLSLLIILLLKSSLFSLISISPDAFQDGSLQARISSPPFVEFDKIEGSINFSAKVFNPTDEPIALYIMEKSGDKLELIEEASVVPAHGETQLLVRINSKYRFTRYDNKTYAIVGIQKNGSVLGRYITIDISWGSYEKSIRDMILHTNTYALPVLGILIIILIAILLELAYQTSYSPEYTLRTLFFPNIKGKPILEKAAEIMTDPLFWLFEAAGISILLVSIYNNVSSKVGSEAAFEFLILSGMGALILPLAYLVIARLSEKYEKKPIRAFFGLFMWGSFSAFLSFLLSYLQWPIFKAIGLSTSTVSFSFFVAALLAPFFEEFTKGLGILIFSSHREFDDALSGLLFGYTVGVGFSFIENWFYFTSRTNPFELGLIPWGSLVLYRSFFNSIAHGCFAAATAVTIGYIKSHPRATTLAHFGVLPGFFASVVLHVIFNLSALIDGFVISNYNVPVFVFNPLVVVVISIMFLFVYISATREEKIRYLGQKAKDMIEELGLNFDNTKK
ncbi:MAG: PrsW family intramembrane metalloprotease [Candidatus Anstonellales archaeon]